MRVCVHLYVCVHVHACACASICAYSTPMLNSTLTPARPPLSTQSLLLNSPPCNRPSCPCVTSASAPRAGDKTVVDSGACSLPHRKQNGFPPVSSLTHCLAYSTSLKSVIFTEVSDNSPSAPRCRLVREIRPQWEEDKHAQGTIMGYLSPLDVQLPWIYPQYSSTVFLTLLN